MKRIVYLILMIFFVSVLNAQNSFNNYYDTDIFETIKFNESNIKIINYEEGKRENDYIIYNKEFKLEFDNKVPFLVIDEKRLLCLWNEDLLFLYNNTESNLRKTYKGSNNCSEGIIKPSKSWLKASSELKEGDKIYSVANLTNQDLDQCWVESSPGNGVGEWLELKGNCSFIYIMIGYISYNKPYLYEQNARPKKIKISFPEENNKESLIVDLIDTPNPQKINLGFRCDSIIRIDILEVYEGTKYSDCCINSIIYRVY